MLRLRSHNTSPPSGFQFVDKPTQFKAHAWSIRSCAALWYHEQLRRGNNVTIEQAMSDVEQYTCQELMKSADWKNWVMITDIPRFIPRPVPLQPVQARISVVIPSHGKNDRIPKCIDSVKDQVSEVVVCASGYECNVTPTEKIKWYSWDGEKEMGFGAKCNLGARKSTGQFLWFLNDDCYPNSNCAYKMMEVMNANPKIAIVGHLLRYPDGRIQHGGTHRVKGQVGFPHLDVGLEEPSITEPTEMEAVTAASMLVRREAFDQVGGFDESYFLYLEDSDLCLNVREKGWKVIYTPFCEAIHEEHASSRLRTDLDSILRDSTAIFTRKWKHYFEQEPPVFEPFDNIKTDIRVDAVYVHLVGNHESESLAHKFVASVLNYPPGIDLNWVILCNTRDAVLSDSMNALFSQLGRVSYFKHDNSGWDIGAFQAYCRKSQADMIVFFGSSSYARKPDWANTMVSAFRTHGPNAIYGATGNLGSGDVFPHIRTTAFWCTPELFNRYPKTVTSPDQRYPFEHGPEGLTMWAWSQGYQVYVVETENVYAFPDWDNGPEGYQRGTQRNMLFGDRITQPPYFHHP